jgi:hypothetical protein
VRPSPAPVVVNDDVEPRPEARHSGSRLVGVA